MERQRRIHLRPRLAAAAKLIGFADTLADIGCDHGRLSVSALQSGIAGRVIASDISAASAEKARALASYVGVADRMETRCAAGFSALREKEADALAICGMGGILIAQILKEAAVPLMGAKKAVLQPMRGIGELRAYLYAADYRVEEDVVVRDAGRYYQVFSVVPGRDELPEGWPEGFFALGPRAVGQEPFRPLAQKMLEQAEASLMEAKGTRGEAALQKTVEDIQNVLLLREDDGA
ncbi:MAG TPA: class I SAM-dependent methyltransferase [Feifaniaceae bacterium]|nr:class I SAM-dependent methyltransferase [Feifaniaceae bacterium]